MVATRKSVRLLFSGHCPLRTLVLVATSVVFFLWAATGSCVCVRNAAVAKALRERLHRESKRHGAEPRIQRIRAIGERCAALLGPGPSSTEHGDLLYDERGLP